MQDLYSISADELVVDLFAGGGGAAVGVEAGLERDIDIAINHSPAAIAVHRANHPRTKHYCTNIWEVDPVEACAGRPVGFLWASPDCRHFSRAKGGKPKSAKIRSLAWVVVRWAKTVGPRVMCIENVEEFSTWGPLDANGQPNPKRAGTTFRAWIRKLQKLGYSVEYRSLVAADYGSPTTRRRLFMVARRDGAPIVWPTPTHGKGLAPWRTAAEIIDWSLPCRSIFGRKRPLADATMRRIAEGVRRFVIDTDKPFIVPLARPFVMPVTHHDTSKRQRDVGTDPMPTVTGAHRGEIALVSPHLIPLNSESGHARPRCRSVESPLPTVMASTAKHALVAALITKHYGGVVGHSVERTLGTITGKDHHAVTATFLTKYYGTSVGAPTTAPLPTVTANGKGGGHLAEVRALLIKYYGSEKSQQQSVGAPLHTVTSKARFGLVIIRGEPYEIVDIGMRMLAPHELFAAQGFPPDYVIAPNFNGKRLTKTAQISLAGNSVCPQLSEAIVAANLGGSRAAAVTA